MNKLIYELISNLNPTTRIRIVDDLLKSANIYKELPFKQSLSLTELTKEIKKEFNIELLKTILNTKENLVQ